MDQKSSPAPQKPIAAPIPAAVFYICQVSLGAPDAAPLVLVLLRGSGLHKLLDEADASFGCGCTHGEDVNNKDGPRVAVLSPAILAKRGISVCGTLVCGCGKKFHVFRCPADTTRDTLAKALLYAVELPPVATCDPNLAANPAT